MIAEYIGNTIKKMIEKTQNDVLKWKPVDKIDNWEKVKKQIEKTKEVNLKDYFIDDTKSYAVCESGGYVMVLNIRYGNAPVFSPALDKHILVITINAELMPENLFTYDCQGYREMLQDLVEAIEYQRNEECSMPECLYNFFNKVLGEDGDGRVINE